MNSQEKEATLPGDEEKGKKLREKGRTKKKRKNRKENEGGGRQNKKTEK